MGFKLLIIYSISVLALGITNSNTESTDTTTYPPSTYEPSTYDPSTYEPSTYPPSTYEPSTYAPSTYEPTTEASTTTETTTEETTTTATPLTFADYINICTQNLLGINCIVENVYNLESVAENFQYDISFCSSKVKSKASDILEKVTELESYATKIEEANDKICKNSNFKAKNDAAKIPSAKCVKNITKNMNKFNENLEIIHDKVSKFFDKTTNGCASMSLLKFKLTLENFPSLIKECAKMAENV